MFDGQFVFSQLVDFLPRRDFNACVERYRGNYKCRGFSCRDSEYLASWLELRDQAERPVPGYVEEEFRAYLECGILCFGFGRALCTGCGQGFVIAFSCKGRGVCPSCNGRHMAQTAAHLVDHVIPTVPVRQWVISVPKRLRCFLADRPETVAALTKTFLPRSSGCSALPQA